MNPIINPILGLLSGACKETVTYEINIEMKMEVELFEERQESVNANLKLRNDWLLSDPKTKSKDKTIRPGGTAALVGDF
ncbi:hypothetical protein VNO78_13879 [Psophocarpus tetragonolobus]|uniref:Uncharacterized protein n=1 Tax=Psophocarpus tetragonolobus TaxID=3891 RepID=A0AAN9SSE9_PSOTE